MTQYIGGVERSLKCKKCDGSLVYAYSNTTDSGKVKMCFCHEDRLSQLESKE